MKSLCTLLVAALFAVNAQAAMAFLVGQRTGNSVTGAPVLICTYMYAGQRFDKAFPMSSFCPSTIEIQ